MKKIILAFGAIALVAGIALVAFFLPKPQNHEIYPLLAESGIMYADSLIRTQELPQLADKTRDEALREIEALADDWKSLSEKARLLEQAADTQASLGLVNTADAYDKQIITDIFDKAPPGKKIKTLAQELGVSAEKAYKLLEMSQQELAAEAWNEAGDTFERLENTARAIQAGCKVGLMVGGAYYANAAGATLSTLDKASLIVNGADLLFQIGEDGFNIALGYNNQASAIFSDIRTITKPGSAIIGFAGLYNSGVSDFKMLEAFTYAFDQTNAIVQEGEVLGIKVGHKTAETTRLNQSELDDWLAKNDIPAQAEKDSVLAKIAASANRPTIAKPPQAKTETTTETPAQPSSPAEQPEIQIANPTNSKDESDISLEGTIWKARQGAAIIYDVTLEFRGRKIVFTYDFKDGKTKSMVREFTYDFKDGRGSWEGPAGSDGTRVRPDFRLTEDGTLVTETKSSGSIISAVYDRVK